MHYILNTYVIIMETIRRFNTNGIFQIYQCEYYIY